MVKKNQCWCLNCGKLFDMNFGSPIGSYMVCSTECSSAVMNMVDRDYKGIQTDEAIAKVFKDKADEKRKDIPKSRYVWSYSPSEPWSSRTFSSREEAISEANKLCKRGSFFTGHVDNIPMHTAIPKHLSLAVSSEISQHLYDMWGDFSGSSYGFSLMDSMIDSLQAILEESVIRWFKLGQSPELVVVRGIEEHKVTKNV